MPPRDSGSASEVSLDPEVEDDARDMRDVRRAPPELAGVRRGSKPVVSVWRSF